MLMSMNNKDKSNLDASSVISIAFKRWKLIAILTAIAIIAAIVFSSPFFIRPKFKASVILFPAASMSISKALISSSPSVRDDILELGTEDKIDQMLQILNSDDIRERIIEKYDLLEHYRIPFEDPYKMTKLKKRFQSNISFKRTRYMSIEIEVLDTDPEISAHIANDIAQLVDTVISRMQKERAVEAYRIVEQHYHGQVKEIEQKEADMVKLRQKGVFEYEKQIEVITDQLAVALSKNNTSGAKTLQNMLDTLAIYGGEYVSLRDNVIYEREKLAALRVKYYEAKIDAEQNIPQKFVVSKATPPERKSYPVRWLIIFISAVSAGFIGLLTAIILEKGILPKPNH